MSDVVHEITGAIRKALREQKNGTPIVDAIVKVAKDQGLSLDKTRRVAEGVNTLNMLELLKSGKDRTAEFPVADSRDVVRKLISLEKQAHVPKFQEEIATEYMLPDVQQFVPHQDRVMLKHAHATLDQVKLKSPYTKDPKDLTRMAMTQITSMQKRAENLRIDADIHKDRVMRKLVKLARHLQGIYTPTLNQFGKEAESLYGEDALPLLHVLGKIVPQKLHGKLDQVKVAHLVDDRTPAHQMFQQILDDVQGFAVKAAASVHGSHEADSWKERVECLVKKAEDPPKPSWKERIFGNDEENLKSMKSKLDMLKVKKELGEHGPDPLERMPLIGKSLGRAVSGASGLGSAIEGLAALDPSKKYGPPEPGGPPDYYERLRNTMKLQSTIQYVLDKDPVLRERDPETLMPIIQTLTSVAPELARHPAILASALRQASAGHIEALDPLTLEQYAKADSALQKSKALQQQIAQGEKLQVKL